MNVSQAPGWLPSYLVPFFTLSYPSPTPPAAPKFFQDSSYYGVGPLDGCLIITFIAIMAVLRDVTRLYISEPFARWKLTRDLVYSKNKEAARANGNGKANGNGNGHANGGCHVVRLTAKDISRREFRRLHRSVLRFAEQGWSFIYYTLVWFFGLYIHRNLPTRMLNPVDVWINYPYIPIAGTIKFYYLLQTAFYLHQVLIINAEERRKDHWQMMAHHFITVALQIGSYRANHTLVGSFIMLLMDTSDIFLPLAKMLRYLSLSTACDATFVMFLLSWLLSRHVLFIRVIVSFWKDAPKHMPLVWDPEAGRYMTKNTYSVFMSLLIMLQAIQLVWFWMICRVAWLVVTGQGAEDTRSDEEGDDDAEQEKKDR